MSTNSAHNPINGRQSRPVMRDCQKRHTALIILIMPPTKNFTSIRPWSSPNGIVTRLSPPVSPYSNWLQYLHPWSHIQIGCHMLQTLHSLVAEQRSLLETVLFGPRTTKSLITSNNNIPWQLKLTRELPRGANYAHQWSSKRINESTTGLSVASSTHASSCYQPTRARPPLRKEQVGHIEVRYNDHHNDLRSQKHQILCATDI